MLDTKFTRHSLTENRNKKLRFNQEHIFQLYAYVRSQEDRSDKYRSAAGVLLYPSVEHELSEQTAIQGHVFRWQTIDLRRPWQEIEASLVDLGASLAVYT
jgi:5-methylcytosine-specific restriction enzyme subunit McrC